MAIPRKDYQIFLEGRIAGLNIKNRLVRSATFEACMTKDGMVTPKMLALYENLARGGVGMIITGYMTVTPDGIAMPTQTRIYSDLFVDEISKIAEVVHGTGTNCKIIAQLAHAGRQVVHDNDEAKCVGPSDVPSPILQKRAKVLSEEEIKQIIKSFTDAAVRVKKAGFDGVQLHAAHGYLLSSFISPYTNCRNDRYGGALQNRLRIVQEIMTGIRERLGDFPVLIKMNCDDHLEGGTTIDTFLEVAAEIEKLGFDAIEVSGGMWDCLARTEKELGFFPLPIPESRTRIKSPEKQSYYLKYAEMLNLSVPIILVGGNRNIERLENIIRRGKVDFLSMSRPLICEPDLPIRWLEGRGSADADCVSCNSCLLTIKFGSLHCMLKKSKFQQKLASNTTPYLWRMLMK
jgi:2,4-dienoyl-CoA reductase-like NADH-dependent reductase (Old Yellow Enzyme family)